MSSVFVFSSFLVVWLLLANQQNENEKCHRYLRLTPFVFLLILFNLLFFVFCSVLFYFFGSLIQRITLYDSSRLIGLFNSRGNWTQGCVSSQYYRVISWNDCDGTPINHSIPLLPLTAMSFASCPCSVLVGDNRLSCVDRSGDDWRLLHDL